MPGVIIEYFNASSSSSSWRSGMSVQSKTQGTTTDVTWVASTMVA
jgi:hypothetical protein